MRLIFELYPEGSVHIPFSLLQHREGRISQLFFVFISLTLEQSPASLLRFFIWIRLNKTDFLAAENPLFTKGGDNQKKPSSPTPPVLVLGGGMGTSHCPVQVKVGSEAISFKTKQKTKAIMFVP